MSQVPIRFFFFHFRGPQHADNFIIIRLLFLYILLIPKELVHRSRQKVTIFRFYSNCGDDSNSTRRRQESQQDNEKKKKNVLEDVIILRLRDMGNALNYINFFQFLNKKKFFLSQISILIKIDPFQHVNDG